MLAWFATVLNSSSFSFLMLEFDWVGSLPY